MERGDAEDVGERGMASVYERRIEAELVVFVADAITNGSIGTF